MSLASFRNREMHPASLPPYLTLTPLANLRLPQSSTVRDFSGGCYFAADCSAGNTIIYAPLPTRSKTFPNGHSPWNIIDFISSKHEIIVGLKVAVEANSLLAVVTEKAFDRKTSALDLHLLHFPSGKGHQMAALPVIRMPIVSAVGGPKPTVAIEIAGSSVGILYRFDSPVTDDHFFVYNWETGMLRMHHVTMAGSHRTFAFLSEDVVALANELTRRLVLITMPSLFGARAASVELCLPQVGNPFAVDGFTCESGPIRASRRMDAPPDDDIIVLTLSMATSTGFSRCSFAKIKVVLHRHALLNYARSIADNRPEPVPWSRWGSVIPSSWINVSLENDDRMCCVSGSKLACLRNAPRDLDTGPSYIQIFDFAIYCKPEYTQRTPFVGPGETTFQLFWSFGEGLPVFTERIRSGLPHTCSRSVQNVSYAGVMIDSERILGIRDIGSSGAITSFDVLSLY